MSDLQINSKVHIKLSEIDMSAVRAGGPGGQNVNKVSSAIHLRFDVRASSVPNYVKVKLLNMRDSRLTKDGVIVIKANEHRTQSANIKAAHARLIALVQGALFVPKRRIATKPSYGSMQRRLKKKAGRSTVKANRRRPSAED